MSKNIYLTVDTECHDIDKANLYIYGKKGNKEWGVKKILELAKEEQIPVNFFVDVGEEKKYGHEFIKDIVDLIHSYNQPVYFHLHPDYISGDSSRSFLWQYNYSEKKAIVSEALKIYLSYCSTIGDRLVFRAGRYGVDAELYSILSELPTDVLDLSFIHNGNKMCHITSEEIGVMNKNGLYKGVLILPNTRFICFDYFGIKRSVGLDTADATFDEFKRFVSNTKLNNIVLTMHSWNFIRKWFFLQGYIQGDRQMERKFKKSVMEARKHGFEFACLSDFRICDEEDEVINMCQGFKGKLKGIWNNFFRFKKIGRLNKKYFILYMFFYVFLITLVLCNL